MLQKNYLVNTNRYKALGISLFVFALVGLLSVSIIIGVYLFRAFTTIEPNTIQEWQLYIKSIHPLAPIFLIYIYLCIRRVTSVLSFKKYSHLLFISCCIIGGMVGFFSADHTKFNVFFTSETAWYYSVRHQLLQQNFE